MKDQNRKVVIFQWIVIATLVIGAGIGGYMMYTKNSELQAELDSQAGNLSSLRSQLEQAKASTTPKPNESSLPAATPNASATPTPTSVPTATPKVSPTPTKTP